MIAVKIPTLQSRAEMKNLLAKLFGTPRSDDPEPTSDGVRDDLLEDEDWDPDPPPPERVARRALVLAAVAGRGLMEMQLRQGTTAVAEHHPRIQQWLEGLELREECEPEEWNVIVTAPGDLDDQAMVDSTWRLEGLGVLAWALQRFDLPSYDTLVDSNELLAVVGFLRSATPRSLLADPRLRSDEELNLMGEQILAFHWRMRDYSLRPVAMDFRDFGDNCWFGPTSLDWAEIVDGDLALEGLPIFVAPEETVGRCSSSAMERHTAINWLRGWSELYSEVDTST